MIDQLEYEKVRAAAQKLYADTKTIYCPALGEDVYFTEEGFNHLIFKTSRKERNRDDQLHRFNSLEKAFVLIAKATIYQEFEKRGSVCFWGIIAILGNRKIKVVIVKDGKGKARFCSVIPVTYTSLKRDTKWFKDHSNEAGPH
jgi:hypothetical protein